MGQIHLSIEAQCGSPVYLWVTTTHTIDKTLREGQDASKYIELFC